MIIEHDPEDWVVETTSHTCPFHEEHPGQSYAGCTCSGSFTSRLKTPEERAASRPRTRGIPHKEYLITSARLGDWAEILSDIDGVARDLSFNKAHYPDVEFEVLERSVTAWTTTTDEIPVVEFVDHLARWVEEEHSQAEASAAALDELDEWLRSKDE